MPKYTYLNDIDYMAEKLKDLLKKDYISFTSFEDMDYESIYWLLYFSLTEFINKRFAEQEGELCY